MGYEVTASTIHHVSMEDRRSLMVSGVEGVDVFDDTHIVLTTIQGVLTITGEGLRIEKLALDGGDLKVEGKIDTLCYEDSVDRSARGFLSRLFG
ncbi:YabP/YqfC family sporulation protein [Pseudoflavonifractor sp. An85]|uniref:YabP/YqfC family sporulation protein n=1 Tax=Pseudoflavonifractor sp. An85 TaxID=1965661 RepID=UPI000B37F119|nr:YabP/YqfC family sporulation protein [Pseudoflavonifractor sp. An85]OUN24272.1 hypothetical protein B5G37_08240 [Pseudoflavonifractor sp. An85]